MSQSSSRLVELDFFRGLVLLVIVVDHIGGSILSRVTLHAYALCDAAEVFVFLGGYATATAWASLCARKTEAVARRRFIRRSFEIYRAFVVTAVLMLVVSAILLACNVDAPNLTVDDLDDLTLAPAAALRDIVLLRRQPYLAGVLPMYAWFALGAPLALPLARTKPWLLLAGSLALWALAPLVAPHLPHVEDMQWDFNPLGWQLLFVLGVIARTQPVFQRVSAHRFGWIVTVAALGVVAAAAVYRLHLGSDGLDAEFKRNLAWFRVLNFLGVAWLTAHLIRHGWAKRLARALPWIGLVGRKGLLSFVAGAVISLVVDSMLYWYTDGYLNVPLGLAADAVALGSLLLVARASDPLRRLLPAKAKACA
ncbi:OpgC domain-containing protein [Paraburkholderia dinghuensis]|uniref:OpgC domain-containing protein n=1 Tax=Paraburkholderia dinghuensis TaxID=2305225 RepID=A0A3N6MYR4_9BURK|nr:OpgC domain-containing protein [Paraburkholderia dinghuensis]RQH08919.1 OpgC domain-containing protein [Paraburkholderia dinghuensis]